MSTNQEKDYILEVKDLKKYYPIKGGFFSRVIGHVKAVDGISFNIERGTTMGLVGESGCGKSTTGRTLLRLEGEKTGGEVLFNGKEVYDFSNKAMNEKRTEMQIIFQDPFASLQPRMPVGEIIGEAVREHKIVPSAEYDEYVEKIMDECGLQSFQKERYPHEFSGGQRQRICIARAIALQPEFIVCDEPVSALDVSIQAQIINLLEEIQAKLGVSYIFIAHDLAVVKHISDRVLVMYLGHIVEIADCDELYKNPLHPYTEALLQAVPEADPDVEKTKPAVALEGEVPSIINRPAGCPFHDRCKHCMERCTKEVPKLTEFDSGHQVACFLFSKE